MKKIISVVLALVMTLGSISFATSIDKYNSIGNELKGMGIITGQDGGNLNPFGKLTREQSLVVLSRMMGKESEARVTNFESGFSDLKSGNFYKPYIEYSKLKGWTRGVSSKRFGIGEPTTTKVMATFMLRALGYSADWKTEDIMQKASQIGLLEGVSAAENDHIIRGEVFIIMNNTLHTNSKNENEKLIYKLKLATNPNPPKSEQPSNENKPKPQTPSSSGNRYGNFDLLDVKSDNLKEIRVEFSKDVDSSSIKDSFTLTGYGVGNIAPRISEEQKNVVVLQLGTRLKNNQEYKLRVRGVKSAFGDRIQDGDRNFSVRDTEIPRVERISLTGPRSFKVIFTEPIDYKNSSSNLIKLTYDNERRSISTTVTPDPANLRVLNVRASSNLREDINYDVLIRGFRDFAGYSNIDSVERLDYIKVTDSPEARIVKATEEYVVVEFTRPVKGLYLENFYHTYSVYKPFEAYKSESDLLKNENRLTNFSNTSFTTIALRFVNPDNFNSSTASSRQHPLIEGNVRFMVLGSVGNRKVTDEWNNQLQDREFNIQITTDKTRPVVENVEVISDRQINVTFSKPVILNKSNYEIRQTNGNRISGLSYYLKPVSNNKVGIIINRPSMKGKNVEIRVRNVVDKTISRNKIDNDYIRTVEFGDKVFEGVKEVILKVGATSRDQYYHNPTIVVAFKEDMDSHSTTNISNYRFTNDKGKSYFTVDDNTYMPYESILEIKLTREVYETKFRNRDVMVMISQEVKDKAGNGFDSFAQTFNIKSSSSSIPPKLSANTPAKVTGRHKIELSFDDLLSLSGGGREVDRDQFRIYNAEQRLDIDTVTIEGSSSLKIQLSTGELNAIPSDVRNLKVVFTDKTYRAGGLGNTQGVPVASFTIVGKDIKDELAPKYLVHRDAPRHEYSMKDIHYKVNGANKMIVVRFDEEVVNTTFSTHTFKVELANSGDAVAVRNVEYGENKKEVIINLREMTGTALTDFEEAIKAAFYSNDYFNGRSGKRYYKVLRLRVNDGNTIEDKYGNISSRDYVDVYDVKK